MSESDLLALLDATRIATWECAVRSVAHALGTPLNIVLGRAELLLEDASSAPGAQSIASQVHSMEKLISRSIEFPTGVPSADDELTPCRDLVLRVSALLGDSAKAVSFELDPSSPALPRALGCLMLLGLARYGILHAGTGANPQIRCERSATHTTLTLSCSGEAAGKRSVRELAEPWLSDPADSSVEGLELAVALAACRRLRGAATRADRSGALGLRLSWPH